MSWLSATVMAAGSTISISTLYLLHNTARPGQLAYKAGVQPHLRRPAHTALRIKTRKNAAPGGAKAPRLAAATGPGAPPGARVAGSDHIYHNLRSFQRYLRGVGVRDLPAHLAPKW